MNDTEQPPIPYPLSATRPRPGRRREAWAREWGHRRGQRAPTGWSGVAKRGGRGGDSARGGAEATPAGRERGWRERGRRCGVYAKRWLAPWCGAIAKGVAVSKEAESMAPGRGRKEVVSSNCKLCDFCEKVEAGSVTAVIGYDLFESACAGKTEIRCVVWEAAPASSAAVPPFCWRSVCVSIPDTVCCGFICLSPVNRHAVSENSERVERQCLICCFMPGGGRVLLFCDTNHMRVSYRVDSGSRQQDPFSKNPLKGVFWASQITKAAVWSPLLSVLVVRRRRRQ